MIAGSWHLLMAIDHSRVEWHDERSSNNNSGAARVRIAGPVAHEEEALMSSTHGTPIDGSPITEEEFADFQLVCDAEALHRDARRAWNRLVDRFEFAGEPEMRKVLRDIRALTARLDALEPALMELAVRS
jgi:hypothetical protein